MPPRALERIMGPRDAVCVFSGGRVTLAFSQILAGKLKPNLGQFDRQPDWEEILT